MSSSAKLPAPDSKNKSVANDADAKIFRPPLKPQRTLLWIISAVMVIWVAILVTMYFVSVYPQRHGANAKPEHVESD